MNGNLCQDCGQDHQSGGEALDCTERMADLCGCGKCRNCREAAWWRQHPQYAEWQDEKASRLVIEVKVTSQILQIDPANHRVLIGLFSNGKCFREFWAPLDPDGDGGEPLPVEEVA